MPIKDESIYPGGSTRSKEWKAIREKILVRAGNHCELCHVPNGIEITRDKLGGWHSCFPGDAGTKVVLTIAHINQDPTDNRDVNLLALCQRCHNKIDMPYRRLNAEATRRAKKANGDLPGVAN